MTPSPPPRSPEPSLPSGARGEQLAAEWLRRHGYKIVARNLRTVHGEIDLLVRRWFTWAAVEVKARADHPAPERLVDGERLDRLERSLRALCPTLRPRPWRLRIDVIAVRWCDPEPEVRHFPAVRTLRR